MIKSRLSNGTLLLGLSALNVAKLKQGLSIVFDGRPFGFASDVIIMYGETDEAILTEIMPSLHVERLTKQ